MAFPYRAEAGRAGLRDMAERRCDGSRRRDDLGAEHVRSELNLMYFGTGNPQPVLAGKGREGDNLYTESIVALNPDTGKLAWYFQPSPHDTHDWDAVQTPVLFDGEIAGRPRKLLAQASRNGWFFVLDRTNGKSVVTSEFVKTNWAKGV